MHVLHCSAVLLMCNFLSDAWRAESDSLGFLRPVSRFRETNCSVTPSLHPQLGVLGETDVQGNNKGTLEEQKADDRKTAAATMGKSQELKKVLSPFFPY